MSETMFFVCLTLLGCAADALIAWVIIRIFKHALGRNPAKKADDTNPRGFAEVRNQLQMQLALYQQDMPAGALLQMATVNKSEDLVNLLFVGDLVLVVLNCQVKGQVKISDDFCQTWKTGKKGVDYGTVNPFCSVHFLARALKRCDPTKKLRFVGIVFDSHLREKNIPQNLKLPRGIFLARETEEIAVIIELLKPQGTLLAANPLLHTMGGSLDQTIKEMIERNEY